MLKVLLPNGTSVELTIHNSNVMVFWNERGIFIQNKYYQNQFHLAYRKHCKKISFWKDIGSIHLL
jgi:hypothetical protein